MKIPNTVREEIINEAIKNSRFKWYSGWEKSSGYIASDLRGSDRYGTFRIYIKWEKKKEPTDIAIKAHIENYIDQLLEGKEHTSKLKDFRYYIRSNYFVDLKRLQDEIAMSIDDCLHQLIISLEKSNDFAEPWMQHLHNELKNYEAAKEEFDSIEYLHGSIANTLHQQDGE